MWKGLCVVVSAVLLLTIASPLLGPAAAPDFGGGTPPGPGQGPIASEGSGPESGPASGGSYLPASQTLVNGTLVGGDCGSAWTFLNASDDLRCSYQEADRSPADQVGVVLLPNGDDVVSWSVSGCQTDATAHDDLDDPENPNDGDATCRQGSTNGNRVGVALQNPTWTDPTDIDDFTVTAAVDARKVSSLPASITVDVKVGASAYHVGAIQSTTTSYVRYNRAMTTNPISGSEWTTADVDGLVVAARCGDCSPNDRATKIQATVDGVYNAEYALEVRFTWSAVPTLADAWYLALECSRLNPGGGNVTVQVGQGGTPPASWKTVFRCTSDGDESFDRYPMVAEEVNGGSPIVRLWDAQWDTPDDTVQGVMAVDVLRIDVDDWTDGEVTAAFRQPLNLTGGYANNTIDPYRVYADGVHTYVTTFGNFTATATAPHVLSAYDLDDRLMATGSAVVVEGSPATSISGSHIVTATNTTFQIRYNVTSGQTQQGIMDVTANFSATEPSQLRAVFTEDPGSTLTSWHIRWKIITSSLYLRRSDDTTTYFGNFGSPQLLASSPPDPPSAAVGMFPSVSQWNSTLVANWSNVGTSSLYAGPMTIDEGHAGPGLMIAFPEQLAGIDASYVAQSYDSYATRYSTQKKVFFHDGRYFAFFLHLNGETPSIRYASGYEAGSSMVWNPPIPVVTGGAGDFEWGFDVDARQGDVALVWLHSMANWDNLYFKKGTIRDSVIHWDPESLWVWGFIEAYAPSVAIGADGVFWIALAGDEGVKRVRTFHSTVPGGTSFVNDRMYSQTPPGLFAPSDFRFAVRLVPLQWGYMMLIGTGFEDQEFRWWTWDPFAAPAPAWSGMQTSAGAQLPGNTEKADRFGAADDGFVARVLYIDSGSHVQTGTVSFGSYSGGLWYPGPAKHPAIQRDINGDFHHFWLKKTCSNGAHQIHYMRSNPASPSNSVSNPFPCLSDPVFLTTSSFAETQRTFVGYTSFPGGEVYFASLPTRRGGTGAGDSAWNRPGLHAQGAHLQQLSEYVSPLTGLLHLKHTDLAVPGRGLDLSIQRLYRTPDAFVRGQSGSFDLAWNFEAPLGFSLGQGWSLNFPLVTREHVHLWDGQRYPIRWDGSVFENKEGEYFRLERTPPPNPWYLDTKSGVRYTVSSWEGHVMNITDPTGNEITLGYSGGRLDTIMDTAGRVATFSYVPTTYCRGTGDSPPKVCKVTYGGRTVEYRYSGDLLTSVVDPAGRSTTYTYCASASPCNSVVNPWLVRLVAYPNGARTSFRYRTVQAGTDARAFLVSSQFLADASGTRVLQRTYTSEVVNGAVVFAKVERSEGTMGSPQGSTLYNMDPRAGSVTVTELGAPPAEVKMGQHRLWFAGGRVAQTDVAMGGAAADADLVTYSTLAHHDEYGNPVYTRDGMGNEAFMSYVHSNNRSAYYAPGRFQTTSGAVWVEEFLDRSISDWTKGTAGTVSLNKTIFETLPPSLEINKPSPTGVASASHTYSYQSTDHLVSTRIRANETDRDHHFQIRQGSTIRAHVLFAAGDATSGEIRYLDGANWRTADTYLPGVWYLITVHFKSYQGTLSRFDLYVGGTKIGAGDFLMPSAGGADTVYFQAGSATTTGKMWVDDLAVFLGTSVIATGLPTGGRLRVLDPRTGKPLIADSPATGGMASLTLGPSQFPGMVVQVLDAEWSPIYTSPVRQIWGGTTFAFTPPRLISEFTKTSSGFPNLAYLTVWVDDEGGIPPQNSNPVGHGEEWVWQSWPPDSLVLRGNSYHWSKPKAPQHGHSFGDSSNLMAPASNEYAVQFVYLTRDAFPAELIRTYRSHPDGSWAHRAYWGASLDNLGGDNQTDARRWMGTVPSVFDRWLMTLVRQDDIGTGADSWKGAGYYVVGGGARWDVTAKGLAGLGQIRVFGLPANGVVDMVDRKGVVKVTGTADTLGTAVLDVYAKDDSFRNAFPVTASFVVYSPGRASRLYDSPWFENVFGGDEFSLSGAWSKFFSNGGMDIRIKDRLAGTYRVQSGTTILESYFRYDPKGNLVEARTRDGPLGWVSTTRTPDPYGNIVAASTLYDDAYSHETTYQFGSAYQASMLTGVSDLVGGSTQLAAFEYDFNTGELKSVTPPKLQPPINKKTSYDYDTLGRLTRVAHPDGAIVTQAYVDAENLVIVTGENHASEVLRPNGPGSHTQWSIGGTEPCRQPPPPQENWECVDEADPHDLDRTYVFETVNGERDQYAMSGLTVLSSVGSVTVVAVASFESEDWCDPSECFTYFYLTLNGYLSPLKYAGWSWTKVSHTWTLNPATGAPWTTADIVDLQTGVQKFVPGSSMAYTETRVTQLYVVVVGSTGWHTSWRCYDVLGRLTKVYRFDETGPPPTPGCGIKSGYYSLESFVYDGLGQVTEYTAPRGPGEPGRTFGRSYDALGRLLVATNPDGTYVDIAYDDALGKKTVTVTEDMDPDRKTEYWYDWNGRLVTVREFWDAGTGGYYDTTYEYDAVGNLRKVLSPVDSIGVRQETTHEYDHANRVTKTTFPDGTYEQYWYYRSGTLKQKRDRAGLFTTYTNDVLRRPDTIAYPDGSSADYDYDANGNLLRLSVSQAGQPNPVVLDYTYVDERDWVRTETTTVDGVARTVTYTHDSGGNVIRIQGPSGYDVHYRYDGLGRLCAVAASIPSSCAPGLPYHATLSYFRDDALDTITYGNGGGTSVTTKHTYDANARPLAIYTDRGATPLLRLDYEAYDALGDPLRIKATGQDIPTPTYECYAYDGLGRLTSAKTATSAGCAYAPGAWAFDIAFSYDALGNRLSVADGGTTNYRYDAYSRLCWTKVGTPPACTTPSDSTANRYNYNARGELTSRVLLGQTWTFGWGPEGRLTSESGPSSFTATYAYDGLGRRVKSVINGVTNVYVYSGLSVIVETNPATKYVFAAGMRLARIQGATTEYDHYDHLGNVRLVTNGANGNVASMLAYRPFGLPIVVSGAEPMYGYTGEYRESTPNLVYLHARWYDPTIGRFLSPDDRLGRLSMPQDQNRYAYVVNNPMAYTDPTGHLFWIPFLIFLGVVLGSAAVNTAVYAATCGSSCSLGGYVGAFVGGAVAGAIGFWTAGAGYGIWGVMAAGALANAAAYTIAAAATGTFTWEGLIVAGAMGPLLAGFGYGVGKAVGRFLHRPPTGGVAQGGSKIATAGQPAEQAARQAHPPIGQVTSKGVVVNNPGALSRNYLTPVPASVSRWPS